MHLEADMINAVSNYEKTKLSMANVFLQYDQDTMIAKFSLKHDPSWLYLSFVKRIYRINRKSGNVQWSEDDKMLMEFLQINLPVENGSFHIL